MRIPERKTPAILIVDDNFDLREALCLLLNSDGYQTASANTFSEAIELIKQRKFDLYLLDTWLPDGSGIDLCQRIRVQNEKAPIVFYSGDGFEKNRIMAMDAGAKAFILKPATIDELEEVISDLVRNSD
ncbi:MAG TPA: response regulator [Blastocatellia bacterium]|nr:response regulator [Blastocatellia bacterium]